MLNYWALRIALIFLPFLPRRVARSLAFFVAYLAYWLCPRSRAVVRDNLRHALGAGGDGKGLEQTVRAVFRNSTLNYLELALLPRFSLAELEQKVAIHGKEHFFGALAEGRGVIIATAHLGNFTLVVQVLVAWSLKLTALVEPVHPTRLFRLVTGLRASKGLTFLPVGPGALKATLKALRRGEVVAVACDLGLNGRGLEVSFLGEETILPCGAVELALRTGAAIVPAFSERQGERFSIYLEPPIRPSGHGDGGQRLRQPMEQVVAAMEKHVRRCPEQWVMFQPLWAGRGRGK